MNKKTICVLGCGWLGTPLAKNLISLNFNVKGSTTTSSKLYDLKLLGINPHLIELGKKEENLKPFLSEAATIIINIPPKLRTEPVEKYLENLSNLLALIEDSSIEKVVFVSSTSVYAESDNYNFVTEDNGPFGTSPKSKSLLKAEGIFTESKSIKTTIIRFGGLIGEDRHPAKFLSGREGVKNPEAPVNLVHQTDCINLITSVIVSDTLPKILNGVYPDHPTKENYYKVICAEMKLDEPKFEKGIKSVGKIVSSEKSSMILGFEYEKGIY